MDIRFIKPSSLGIVALLIAACGYAAAQDSSPKVQLVSANAQLTESLNTKTAKPGQPVTAKLTSAAKASRITELPKGTMLIGKVDQVQAASGSEPTKLSLVFDQAKLKDGMRLRSRRCC